jgi:hypothetical protein
LSLFRGSAIGASARIPHQCKSRFEYPLSRQVQLPSLSGHLINVRAEKSGLGLKIAARRRFFRRPQQFIEAIGVLLFAYILPGQFAKTIKGEKRISRLVLNRRDLKAELSFKRGTVNIQLNYSSSHTVLLTSFDQG